jgi:hypothetical protein
VLAIATYATKSYFHVWPQFLRRIAAAAGHHAEAHFILATDQSDEAKAAVEAAKVELPEGWRIQAVQLPLDDGGVEGKDYKEPAQMRIAALQGAAFAAARKIRATALWSVEADNLVPPDALRVAEWALTDAHRRRLAVLPCRRRDLSQRIVPRRKRHTAKPDCRGLHGGRTQAAAAPCPRLGGLPRPTQGLPGQIGLASGRASASGGWPSASANARQTAMSLRSRPSTDGGAGRVDGLCLPRHRAAEPLCRATGAALAARSCRRERWRWPTFEGYDGAGEPKTCSFAGTDGTRTACGSRPSRTPWPTM